MVFKPELPQHVYSEDANVSDQWSVYKFLFVSASKQRTIGWEVRDRGTGKRCVIVLDTRGGLASILGLVRVRIGVSVE